MMTDMHYSETEKEQNWLVGLLSKCQFLRASERPAMQPAVTVNGHRAALKLLDIGLTWGLLEERQQTLNTHLYAVRYSLQLHQSTPKAHSEHKSSADNCDRATIKRSNKTPHWTTPGKNRGRKWKFHPTAPDHQTTENDCTQESRLLIVLHLARYYYYFFYTPGSKDPGG